MGIGGLGLLRISYLSTYIGEMRRHGYPSGEYVYIIAKVPESSRPQACLSYHGALVHSRHRAPVLVPIPPTPSLSGSDMHTKAISMRDRALAREVPDMVTAPAADNDAGPVPTARVHDDR